MKTHHAKALTSIVAVTLAFFLFAPMASASKNSRGSWTFMVYLDADNSLDSFGPINL